MRYSSTLSLSLNSASVLFARLPPPPVLVEAFSFGRRGDSTQRLEFPHLASDSHRRNAPKGSNLISRTIAGALA
ncbi:hypothetical protein N7490_010171 [Penicillium lividum]|nr:hypothetical protein N7490_010171 [Penicillium lividum]